MTTKNESVEGKIRQAVAAVASIMFGGATKTDRADILAEVDLDTIENVIAGQLALAAEALNDEDDPEDDEDDAVDGSDDE